MTRNDEAEPPNARFARGSRNAPPKAVTAFGVTRDHQINQLVRGGRAEPRARSACGGSAIEGGQIEFAEALGVGQDVDFGDLIAVDRESHDREQLAVEHAEQAGRAVDEHR